ncbi:Benzyl alcohol O-benzoyltransferase [Quillaja saponaria]|uniref:Benzyl alcohol O-benzoyltransferase n=1 Tax=Quillaja saponaria TaxID=32244 RepID=A0AAD7PPL8_QUISA|nr:Benzyl alcohol O-benzoyltransferase [Quillaja saponaria]
MSNYCLSSSSSSSLQYLKVKRWEPKLIVPAKPTPYEQKKLSDIDNQEALRYQVPIIMFYPNNLLNEGKDPAKVICEAVGKALVPYYPFAGRLIEEGPNKKLTVDCNEEGVLFIEAEANVTLDQLGHIILPLTGPFLDEFLHDLPGCEGIIGCPLLLFQVTRLLCGGFVFAVRINHTMADAPGMMQFLNAIAEFAHGATEPSVSPVWERHLLNARDPPRINLDTNQVMEVQPKMVIETFYFGPSEINAIKKHVEERCTTFELLTACLWKCRTEALELEPEQIVRLSFVVNLRWKKHKNLHVPSGYYGNAFGFPVVISKAGDLCKNSLGYVVELVKKTKAQMSENYVKSVADFMVIMGQPESLKGNFFVSDVTRVGYGELDFGWGKPVCAGPCRVSRHLACVYRRHRNRGEDGIAVPICLPELAMARFCQELKKMKGNGSGSFKLQSEV